jgi:hypothetical protein
MTDEHDSTQLKHALAGFTGPYARHCERVEAIQSRKKDWIASSRSLSSGAHSRDPVAPGNDEYARARSS